MKVQSAIQSAKVPGVLEILRVWSGRGLSLLAGAFVGILLSALFQNGQGSQSAAQSLESSHELAHEKTLKAPSGLMNRRR